MKKISFILLIFFLFSCNNESSDKQSSDGKEGSTATFILKNSNMYVVDHSNLNVFSITNPENPVKVRTVNVGFNIETLFSNGNYLFIGSRNGMFIYSIAEPENPTFVSQALHLRACDPVVANSTNAFVTLHSNTVCGAANNVLMVYNTTDIKQPKLIAQRDLSEPKGLALNGNYLYICDKNDIVIFDITNPQNPSAVKTIANVPARDLIIDNNRLFAFTSSDVKQYSIDPANIQNISLISSYTL
ncbi:hypothetical protein ASG31_13500 [Chryseobacterium sp. Leaf404]|uniref:LVIVD repeat-containing protein n=1 Tax=unclassified Chryseobacterium TaxID=2593645 RepID=UPI0006FA1865|nr:MULTISPECIES: hypothetical protein [unclassified Chryseobacterium]KQT16535.1 hypothetical protein ASG31_13500 [Chryseobacterium sp. Leaf404]